MLLCTGGCRSGKSEFARRWAESQGAGWVYIATARVSPDDGEMRRRVERHRAARGEGWAVLEAAAGHWREPEQLAARASAMGTVLLFDCLTLWTALCLENGLDTAQTLELAGRLFDALRGTGKPVALVTNEVGMGIVPENALARRFRDLAGLVNQKAAASADTVVFMVSGLPLYVKGTPPGGGPLRVSASGGRGE